MAAYAYPTVSGKDTPIYASALIRMGATPVTLTTGVSTKLNQWATADYDTGSRFMSAPFFNAANPDRVTVRAPFNRVRITASALVGSSAVGHRQMYILTASGAPFNGQAAGPYIDGDVNTNVVMASTAKFVHSGNISYSCWVFQDSGGNLSLDQHEDTFFFVEAWYEG